MKEAEDHGAHSVGQRVPWFLCPPIDDKGTTELRSGHRCRDLQSSTGWRVGYPLNDRRHVFRTSCSSRASEFAAKNPGREGDTRPSLTVPKFRGLWPPKVRRG